MKRGITLVSMIIYLVLFTAFTAFVIAFSSNMNRNVMSDKGKLFVQTEYEKLYMNLFTSAKDSVNYVKSGNNIRFSNGDLYVFDTESHNIFKNGGILVQDVEQFDFKDIYEFEGVSIDRDILEKNEALGLNVTFLKYGNEVSRDIVIAVGDGTKWVRKKDQQYL